MVEFCMEVVSDGEVISCGGFWIILGLSGFGGFWVKFISGSFLQKVKLLELLVSMIFLGCIEKLHDYLVEGFFSELSKLLLKSYEEELDSILCLLTLNDKGLRSSLSRFSFTTWFIRLNL